MTENKNGGINVRIYEGFMERIENATIIIMDKKEAEEFIDVMMKLWYPVIYDKARNMYYIPLLGFVIKVKGENK